MKIFLPFIIIAAVLLTVLSPSAANLVNPSFSTAVAQTAPSPAAPAGSGTQVQQAAPADDTWVKDADVTFVGKTAARSGTFLDWALSNYNWVSLNNNDTNPLATFWKGIRNIVYAFFALFVLITAFVIMITRGRNITVMKFIPRFIGIILLVTFSFALVQFFYQVFDIIQSFFLRNPDDPTKYISQANLLNISFNYGEFIGYRKAGVAYDEAAMITMILTRLTAITYYVMVGVLIVRKIILWFFIIISPVFPLLLLYRPVRNTGKLWLGEFFRWLLYAPLFSMFLSGLVGLWRAGVPLFSYTGTGEIVAKSGKVGETILYPTAINILLGGPKQSVAIGNSINLPETFALYVICLIMLWVVIILPFILLRIFLDYAFSISLADNTSFKRVVSMANSFINRPPPPSPVGPQSPPSGAGLAKALPMTKKFSLPEGVGRTISLGQNVQNKVNEAFSRTSQSLNSRATLRSSQNMTEISKLTNLSVPTMRDIARYETSQLSTKSFTSSVSRTEINQVNKSLQSIANPTQALSPVERERFTEVRNKLVTESQKGNVLATTILNAANNMTRPSTGSTAINTSQVTRTVIKKLANPEHITDVSERTTYTQVKENLLKENQSGNQMAASLLAYVNNISDSSTNISTESVQKMVQNISNSYSNNAQSSQLKNQLQIQSKQGNSLATMILSLSSASQAPTVEQLTELREQIVAGQKTGDTTATSVIASLGETEVDMSQLHDKLTKAKAKGDKVAGVILSLIDAKSETKKASPASLPTVNRIQTVSLDDYEAVKKTWRDSYKSVDVPQKLNHAQSRREWIQSDINTISNTISLLSSPDADKKSDGMKAVSGILPFLLIGGFSQNEIVTYLKAKLEAAKDISSELEEKDKEEGSLLEAKQQTVSAPKSMHMTTTVSSSDSVTDDEPQSDLQAMSKGLQNTGNATITNQMVINSPIAQLSIPSLKEIARLEADKLITNTFSPAVEQVTKQLALISHPNTAQAESRHYQEMQDKLTQASQNGDGVSTSVLRAAESVAGTNLSQSEVLRILKDLAHPELITETMLREKTMNVKNSLVRNREAGDKIAEDIVSHIFILPNEAELKLLDSKISSAALGGNPSALSFQSLLAPKIALPEKNNVQAVSIEDYEAVKQIWLESYRKLANADKLKAEAQLITEVIAEVENVLPEKRAEGMHRVGVILPFLLLGGFSQTEVVAYLKAKFAAAQAVLSEISASNQNSDSQVEVGHKVPPQQITMSAKPDST